MRALTLVIGLLRVAKFLKQTLRLNSVPRMFVREPTEIVPVVDVTPEVLDQGLVFYNGTKANGTLVTLSDQVPLGDDDRYEVISAGSLS